MKTFKYLAAAALTMLAVSCNKEQITEVPDGQMVDVTFTAALPGEMATKTIGDGMTAKNLYVSVYENDAEKTKLDLDKTATFTDLKTQVTFSLVKGKTYNFVFWAQAEDAPYDVTNLKNIKVKNYTSGANDENRDAFYATRKELKVNGALTETIKLYRPFAQVNFATADYADALKAGFNPAVSSFTASEAATTFDTFAEEGKDKVEVALTETEVPADVLKTLDGKTYTRLAMNYLIPVGKQGESHNIDVAATFKANNGEAVTVSAPNAPVQNNYRTNILGNLLTSQVIFNVEIVPIFNEPDNDIDIVNVKDEASLRALFATGGEAKLAADLVLDKSVAVEAGKEVVLDLNGKTISNTEDLWDEATYNWSLLSVRGGALTLTGDGVVKAKEDDVFAVDVQDGGNLVIEGGEYVGNMDAVYAYEGTVEINGGKFSIQQLSENPDPYGYILNCYDANYKNGSAKIIVTGGEFVKFNPADCAAEGAHTNFLADGYVSVENGNVWTVLPGVKNLADIRAALNTGNEVALANDLTLDAALVVPTGSELVLNLNGKTIKNNTQSAAIYVTGNLVINGEGTVDGGEGGSNIAVWAKGGNVTINGGTFTVGKDASGEGNSCIYSMGGNVKIYGGYFRTDIDWRGWYYVLNQQNGNPGTITVYGGQFENYDPSKGDDNLGGSFVPAGYKSEKVDGTDVWKVVKE